MSSLNSFIREHSQGLGIGYSTYTNCPNCNKHMKFGITKYVDKILYQCFSASCGTKGAVDTYLNKDNLTDILNRRDYYPVNIPHDFKPESHWVDGFNTIEAIELAQKYDLIDAYYTHKAFKTATDIKLQRQVFYYTNQDKQVIGATGRAFIKGISKSHVYPYSTKSPWVLRASNEAVIVEDIFSAVRAYNCGYTGIALSGTTLQEDWLGYFRNYTKLYIALDKDAAIKAINIRKSLQYFMNDVIIVLLERDLKDMTNEEVIKKLGSYK